MSDTTQTTLNNTYVLPHASEFLHLFTQEDLDLLKYHLLEKLEKMYVSDRFKEYLVKMQDALRDKQQFSNMYDFLQSVTRLFRIDKSYFSDVVNKSNKLTLVDIPMLHKLLKLIDYDYFISSIRTRTGQIPLNYPY